MSFWLDRHYKEQTKVRKSKKTMRIKLCRNVLTLQLCPGCSTLLSMGHSIAESLGGWYIDQTNAELVPNFQSDYIHRNKFQKTPYLPSTRKLSKMWTGGRRGKEGRGMNYKKVYKSQARISNCLYTLHASHKHFIPNNMRWWNTF